MAGEVMNMTVGQIVQRLSVVLILVGIFIEITPIKLNPLSYILGWIGKRTNKDLTAQIKCLAKKVDQLEEQAVVNCRVRILQFGDEVRCNVKHSKESFDQALSDIDTYDKYCRDHPDFANNKTILTTQIIKDVYAHCVDANDFL